MKKICFTVNNDLNFDQRMIRICDTLASDNFRVSIIGKRFNNSTPLLPKIFYQHRIKCHFKTGKLAYIEFNIKLLCYLLFRRTDCLCAIDLDTIYPVLLVSLIKKCKKVYDAHELFTEMKEIVSRPSIQKIWNWVERTTVPKFPFGYTVNQSIAEIFKNKYGVNYAIIRNIPKRLPLPPIAVPTEKFLIYQGAVNYGRCLEYLIPAMKNIPAKLFICGDGNYMEQSRQLVIKHQLENKVMFKGMLLPKELIEITFSSYIGINLVEPDGLNQLYSLANKFFDYIHAALPQVSMDFTEYARVNKEYKVALLLPEPDPVMIAEALNLLLENDVLYKELKENCIRARNVYNWQREEEVLLGFYRKLLGND